MRITALFLLAVATAAVALPSQATWTDRTTPNTPLLDATELLLVNGGVAAKTWTIPLAPALVGVEFHVQGAVMDPGINAAGFALSNAGTVHIGQV